jgi:hypothetical protein
MWKITKANFGGESVALLTEVMNGEVDGRILVSLGSSLDDDEWCKKRLR